MEWDATTIEFREVCNGAMFISAVIMMGIFACYFYRNRRIIRDWWRGNLTHRAQEAWNTMQAAVAIIVLLSGHALRAGTSWLEFLWSDMGWEPNVWVSTYEIFAVATALTILGKVSMIYTFSPLRCRNLIVSGTLLCAFGIPLLVLYWSRSWA